MDVDVAEIQKESIGTRIFTSLACSTPTVMATATNPVPPPDVRSTIALGQEDTREHGWAADGIFRTSPQRTGERNILHLNVLDHNANNVY